MKKLWLLAGAALCLLPGCTPTLKTQNEVEIKPIEIKPMQISIDVNVKVKIDRELDDFFNDLDEKAEKIHDEESEVKK